MIYTLKSYLQAAMPEILNTKYHRLIRNLLHPYPCQCDKDQIILNGSQLFTLDCIIYLFSDLPQKVVMSPYAIRREVAKCSTVELYRRNPRKTEEILKIIMETVTDKGWEKQR